MDSVAERLFTLRVKDVMSRRTITAGAAETMDEAALQLLEHEISGMPVADEAGKLIGVISAHDFVEQMVASKSADSNEQTTANTAVRERMSTSVQSVTADLSLLQACRLMCAYHVHRLPVLDNEGCVEGVVTSLDVVAALVNALDE